MKQSSERMQTEENLLRMQFHLNLGVVPQMISSLSSFPLRKTKTSRTTCWGWESKYSSVLSCPLSHWSFRKQRVSHILNLVLRNQSSFWSLCSWGSHVHQVFHGTLFPSLLHLGMVTGTRETTIWVRMDKYGYVCMC